MPIVALEQDYSEYEQRMRELAERRKVLGSNVELMEQCCADICASVEAATAYLQHYRDAIVQAIRAEQAVVWQQIEAAGEEAENCLAQGTLPVTPLAQALWMRPPQELKVFRYEIKPPDLQAVCQAWTFYACDMESLCRSPSLAQVAKGSVQQESDVKQLVYIQETQIQLFSLSNRVWTSSPLRFPMTVNEGSRYIWTASCLFCSGGRCHLGEGKNGCSRREAYLLSPDKNWSVTRLVDMLRPRAFHGLWHQKGVVVVFGGMSYAGLCKDYGRLE